jgi:hypothetical protein
VQITTTGTTGNDCNVISLLGSSASGRVSLELGKAQSSLNDAVIGFHYNGLSATNNSLGLGFYGGEDKLLVYGTGQIGIGMTESTPPTLAGLAVRNTTNMQINFGSSTEGAGAYLHSSVDSQCLAVGGGKYSSGNWVATATSSSHIDMVNGGITFKADTGLTAGNQFAPRTVGSFAPTTDQWTFTDATNALDLRAPLMGSKQPDAIQSKQICIYKDSATNNIMLVYNDNGTSRQVSLLGW